jgi:hypothetical protein
MLNSGVFVSPSTMAPSRFRWDTTGAGGDLVKDVGHAMQRRQRLAGRAGDRARGVILGRLGENCQAIFCVSDNLWLFYLNAHTSP